MDGLIVKKEWLELILSGKKTWEIRGSRTNKRGRIALIESGSGLIVGTCEIVECWPFFKYPPAKNRRFHQLSDRQLKGLGYKLPWTWELASAKRINPVPYAHPKGAVIWVKNLPVYV